MLSLISVGTPPAANARWMSAQRAVWVPVNSPKIVGRAFREAGSLRPRRSGGGNVRQAAKDATATKPVSQRRDVADPI